jgi:hypothetical protein
MMTPRRPLALVLALALAGCGAEQLQPDQDARACSLAVQVEPGDPVAPTTVTARATVTGPSGVFTYTWTVRHDGAAVAVTPRTPDSRDIDFIATTAGVYDVTLDVDGAGPECTRWQGPVNVRDPGAMPGALRLRFAPAPTSGAPLQERTVIVPGGADFALGVLALDPGVVAPILVVDPGGQRVPSYVRLRSRATPDAVVELVTTAGGGERATLATGRYDVLVVPLVGGLAPAAIANWEPALGALTVGPGTPVTGHLQDETGAGLAGARIAIAGDDDGAPSTVATTASDGSFALAWQLGAGATLTVTPPAGSGRARLRVPLDQLAATRPLTIRYQPGHPIRDLTGTPTRIGGAAPPGGHALIAVELGAIATATDGLVTVDATGTHRDQVALDSAGRLTSYRLTAGRRPGLPGGDRRRAGGGRDLRRHHRHPGRAGRRRAARGRGDAHRSQRDADRRRRGRRDRDRRPRPPRRAARDRDLGGRRTADPGPGRRRQLRAHDHRPPRRAAPAADRRRRGRPRGDRASAQLARARRAPPGRHERRAGRRRGDRAVRELHRPRSQPAPRRDRDRRGRHLHPRDPGSDPTAVSHRHRRACYHRAGVRALLAVLVVTLAVLVPAAARAEPTTVAFLPLDADRRLTLYSNAVATALAAEVRTAGFPVAVVSDVAAVPRGAWLVVDGRLVARGRGAAIELRVRDPEAGRDVIRLAEAAPTLADLDVATRTLAAALARTLAAERAAPHAAADAPRRRRPRPTRRPLRRRHRRRPIRARSRPSPSALAPCAIAPARRSTPQR